MCAVYYDKQLLPIEILPEFAVYKMASLRLLVMNADLRDLEIRLPVLYLFVDKFVPTLYKTTTGVNLYRENSHILLQI